MSLLLRLEETSLNRGGRQLFDGLSFSLFAGEALHVTGPNGSGKTSLLRLISGLLRSGRGTMIRPPALALADDNLALDRELPLGRALAFWGPAPLAGIQAMGIGHLAPIPVRLLSSGQQKKAALARVVASGASLWLLDEPLNALDSDGIARLEAAIRAHLEGGGAVMAASHQPLPGEWRTLELGA